jgi:general stress protein YciG
MPHLGQSVLSEQGEEGGGLADCSRQADRQALSDCSRQGGGHSAY